MNDLVRAGYVCSSWELGRAGVTQAKMERVSFDISGWRLLSCDEDVIDKAYEVHTIYVVPVHLTHQAKALHAHVIHALTSLPWCALEQHRLVGCGVGVVTLPTLLLNNKNTL